MSRLVHLYIYKIEYSTAIYYYKQRITLKILFSDTPRSNNGTAIKHNWTLPFTLYGACAPHKLSPSNFFLSKVTFSFTREIWINEPKLHGPLLKVFHFYLINYLIY